MQVSLTLTEHSVFYLATPIANNSNPTATPKGWILRKQGNCADNSSSVFQKITYSTQKCAKKKKKRLCDTGTEKNFSTKNAHIKRNVSQSLLGFFCKYIFMLL